MALCLSGMNDKFWLLELRYDLDVEFYAEHVGIVYFSVRITLAEIFDDFD